MDIAVIAPSIPGTGGVKSLYALAEFLNGEHNCGIIHYGPGGIADWFDHNAVEYDSICSTEPDLVIYPEDYQPLMGTMKHVCFALGTTKKIEYHADYVVCKSRETVEFAKEFIDSKKIKVIESSININKFKYDGREKKEQVAYMLKQHKHPEMAKLLYSKFGPKYVNIANKTEQEVAEILKDTKVFVWRGWDFEGSPRPPKEAYAAGCHVVGPTNDLSEMYGTDFGYKCNSEEHILNTAEMLLTEPVIEPDLSLIRDGADEKQDWLDFISEIENEDN
jgi:hypothetical protein